MTEALVGAELPEEVAPQGLYLLVFSVDDSLLAVFVSAEGGDAYVDGLGEVLEVRLEAWVLGVSGGVEEGDEGVGLASAEAYVEDDDGVDVGPGVGEAAEDVL